MFLRVKVNFLSIGVRRSPEAMSLALALKYPTGEGGGWGFGITTSGEDHP